MAEEQKKDELTEDQIIDLIEAFYHDPDFEELKRLYLTKSFPEILAVDRREEIHSAFLAWLLDMKESHGLGDFPIKQLLKILVRRDRKQGLSRHNIIISNDKTVETSTGNIYVEILNEDFTITEMYVTREKPAQTEDRKGRMDILINMKAIFPKGEKNILIVIENKVNSDEHDEQTQTYFNHFFTNNAANDKDFILFVYLTPLPKSDLDNLNEPQCAKKEYIQTNYQDLLDYILEPALKKDISIRNRFVIEEYIHSLSLPAIDINSSNKNVNLNTIMAMSDDTKKLLNAFWEKNEPLLMAALSSLVETTDDQNIKAKVGPAIRVLNKRDKTKYRFGGNDELLGKVDLVRTVVQYILINGGTPKDLSDKFDACRKNSTKKNFTTIKKKLEDKMTCQVENDFKGTISEDNKLVFDATGYGNWCSKKKKITKVVYSEVEVENGKYYIYNQWGKGNIDCFVYAFYENFKKETNWGLGDKEIVVIKPNK